MKIVAAEFVRSCERPEQLPPARLPEIAFAGRSNVGKSSLINSLLERHGLAKVSRTPGKTRCINIFRVTTSDPLVRSFYAVDLPGYGYAKVAKSVRAQWGPMIERYLTTRAGLRGILLLVDARGQERQDVTTMQWLQAIGLRVIVVATKSDKLSRAVRRSSLAVIRETLGLGEEVPLIPYSSVTHEGREALRWAIRALLS